jgi:PAS domain S-box-containing protein
MTSHEHRPASAPTDAAELLELGDAFLELDRAWRVVRVNRNQELLSRLPRAQTVGQVVWEVWPELAQPGSRAWRECHSCMEDRVAVQYDDYYAPLELWTSVTAYPVSSGGMALFFRDVTAHRRADDALRQREAEVRAHLAEVEAVLACAPAALMVYDEQGRIAQANAAAQDILGYTPAERETDIITRLSSSRRVWRDATGHPMDVETFPAVRAVRSGETVRDFVLRRRDEDEERWFLVSAAPLTVAERRLGAVVFMTEVTASRRGEEALRQANEKLREADRRKDDFLSAASHELRTPLTTLALHAHGLTRALGDGAVVDPARIRRKLASMEAQLERLDRLVTTLVDVSRVSSGRLHVERQWCDLAQLAADAVERFEDVAERGGSRLTLEAAPTRGRWDPLRIDQVLTNLVDNALKYARGSAVEVRVATRPGEAICSVRDFGPGIPRESQARIFQQWERAAEARVFGGLGLGLWITRQIVEAHGGTISVDSAPGEGATFTVRLPMDHAP